ncbi:MAG: aromatic acid exporter family protein [Clostridiales bacterium]|nr:aromatic acid exporter family protein [Clostridiales bacterium]
MKKFFPKLMPGMRTLKTGLCVFICLTLAFVFHYDWPVFACVASIVCLQDTPEKSFVTGFARVIGTLIGGVIGIILLWVYLAAPYDIIKIPLTTAGIIIAVVSCVALKKPEAASICAITVTVISLAAYHSTGEVFIYALVRMAETAAGVVVAVLVNRFVSRGKHGDDKEDGFHLSKR